MFYLLAGYAYKSPHNKMLQEACIFVSSDDNSVPKMMQFYKNEINILESRLVGIILLVYENIDFVLLY